MILLTGLFLNLQKDKYIDSKGSFIVLNENDLTFNIIDYNECLDSRLLNKDGKKNIFGIMEYSQGRNSYRPYGIASDSNNIYIASNDIIAAYDKNTYKFNKLITSTGRVNTHQIYYYEGHLYRCDTSVNCISKINITTLEESVIDMVEQKTIPSLYECKHTDDKNIYHINSICVVDKKLHILFNRYIDLKHNKKNKVEYEHYNNIINLPNAKYNDYVSNLSKNYLNYKYSPLNSIKRKDKNYLISKHIVYDIEKSSFEGIPKTLYGIKHHSIIVVDNNIWSLCTHSGKLIRKNKTQTKIYNIQPPENYYLRGMTHKDDKLYIFAIPNENIKNYFSILNNYKISDINSLYSCILVIFNIKNETIEKELELPKEIYNINDAHML